MADDDPSSAAPAPDDNDQPTSTVDVPAGIAEFLRQLATDRDEKPA